MGLGSVYFIFKKKTRRNDDIIFFAPFFFADTLTLFIRLLLPHNFLTKILRLTSPKEERVCQRCHEARAENQKGLRKKSEKAEKAK